MTAPLPTLMLIHGSNGAGSEMVPLADLLRPHASVLTPNLLGHGGRPLSGAFEVHAFAQDLVDQLDQGRVDRCFVGGYSVGGLIALYLARHWPERFVGVLTLATKFVFDARTVMHLTYLADPARLSRPGNPRAGQLTRTHAPQDWTHITEANRALFRQLGERPALTDADLPHIQQPALVVSGDRDQIVPADETVRLAQGLPNARCLLFEGYAHPLAAVPLPTLLPYLLTWLGANEDTP